jgi:hypothetical protein
VFPGNTPADRLKRALAPGGHTGARPCAKARLGTAVAAAQQPGIALLSTRGPIVGLEWRAPLLNVARVLPPTTATTAAALAPPGFAPKSARAAAVAGAKRRFPSAFSASGGYTAAGARREPRLRSGKSHAQQVEARDAHYDLIRPRLRLQRRLFQHSVEERRAAELAAMKRSRELQHEYALTLGHACVAYAPGASAASPSSLPPPAAPPTPEPPQRERETQTPELPLLPLLPLECVAKAEWGVAALVLQPPESAPPRELPQKLPGTIQRRCLLPIGEVMLDLHAYHCKCCNATLMPQAAHSG